MALWWCRGNLPPQHGPDNWKRWIDILYWVNMNVILAGDEYPNTWSLAPFPPHNRSHSLIIIWLTMPVPPLSCTICLDTWHNISDLILFIYLISQNALSKHQKCFVKASKMLCQSIKLNSTLILQLVGLLSPASLPSWTFCLQLLLNPCLIPPCSFKGHYWITCTNCNCAE